MPENKTIDEGEPRTKSRVANLPEPIIQRGRRISPIWIIPLIALALGIWLAWKYYAAQGPEITVRFETAEGIVAGKTPVMCRSVNVGTVENVRLTKDLRGVIVTM